MELEHFSHKHPLILNEEHIGDYGKYCCFGCNQPVSGPCYSCSHGQCLFFLHKLCAELPQQTQHPLHPQHPLTLHAEPPYPGSKCGCDACGQGWEYFTYHCSICGFDLDILCAMMAQPIEHKGHNHPLVPLQTHDVFFCLACRESDKGASYLCSTCRFWIHQKCASMPETIQLSSHHHPLTLSYCLPHEWSYFVSRCDLCAKKLNQMAWVYFCGECRYLVHLKCAAQKMKTLRDDKPEIEAEEDIVRNMTLQFPVTNIEYEELRTKLIQHLCLSVGEKDGEPAWSLKHRSHQHQLIPFLNSDGEDICGCCRGPIISNPFYGCELRCNFHLHLWCAELPEELPQGHPCHPQHPLVLVITKFALGSASSSTTPTTQCDGCARICTGFTYSCAECDFNIDVKCASLPGSIRHEVHNEHLPVLRANLEGFCTACHQDLFGFTFTCETCDGFKLHPYCALLPGKITKHRYDAHPFSLTYSPIKGIPEYICEVCENFVNPKCWFYHCLDCDRSTHPTCLIPLTYEWENVGVGSILKYKYHRHRLTVSEMTEDNGASCVCCGKGFGASLAYECKRCSFRLHHTCTRLPRTTAIEFDEHLLTLTEIPIKDHSDEYFCEICKLEITDRKVVYHCSDCNHSAHVTCIYTPPIELNGTPKVETTLDC